MSTNINAFATELQKILTEFGDRAYEALGTVAEDVAKETKGKVKSASPTRSGKYRGGWGTQTDASGRSKTVTVYNKRKPGLPHLLENGHALRGGGRSGAIEHIGPAEEWAVEEVVNRLERELSQ